MWPGVRGLVAHSPTRDGSRVVAQRRRRCHQYRRLLVIIGSIHEYLAFRLVNRRDESRLGVITTRRILYWLAATVVVFVVGLMIGLIWADTSDVAGSIAGVATVGGGLGIVFLLIALVVVTRRQGERLRPR